MEHCLRQVCQRPMGAMTTKHKLRSLIGTVCMCGGSLVWTVFGDAHGDYPTAHRM